MSENDKLEDLKTIKEWISKQPHLPQNIDDPIIMRFLHTCRFSLEKTKYLMDLFYTIRSQAPEMFTNRDPKSPEMQDIFKTIDLIPLPKMTEQKYRIFIYRLADPDPDKYHYVNSLKAFFMVADIRMLLEEEIPNGEIPIFDMKGVSLKHLTKVSLPVMKKYMVYTQEAHPIRLKQIHVINTAPFLDRLLAIVKPFMKSEVAKLLHFHLPNSETLYEYIPKDLLPEEYGGKNGKIPDLKEECMKKMMACREHFLDESKWTIDETKRPAESKNNKNLLKMEGSFRSLNID